jgi:hypothetical protein
MRVIALGLMALVAGFAAQAAPLLVEARHAELFAKYDCCGRLEHSEIRTVGDIRSGGRTFTIYSLWFVNPQSLHGMRRLAVAEGRRFRGSYIISSSAKPVLKAGVIKFACEGGAPCNGDDFTMRDGKLPSQLLVDGEINQLEGTI